MAVGVYLGPVRAGGNCSIGVSESCTELAKCMMSSRTVAKDQLYITHRHTNNGTLKCERATSVVAGWWKVWCCTWLVGSCFNAFVYSSLAFTKFFLVKNSLPWRFSFSVHVCT